MNNIFLLLASFFLAGFAVAKDVNAVAVYLGGGKDYRLSTDWADHLAQFDIIIWDRWRYDEMGKNRWAALKDKNEGLKILLYQIGTVVSENKDHYTVKYLNNIGRYKISRGHPKGAVLDNDWILENNYGSPFRRKGYRNNFLLDFGSEEYIKYWCDVARSDIVDQEWRADGVFVDSVEPYRMTIKHRLAGYQAKKYPDKKSWNDAMNNFVSSTAECLGAAGQLAAHNRGNIRPAGGFEAWLKLDEKAVKPRYLVEEGAFAVGWGRGVVQFFPHDEWLKQISAPSKIQGSSIIFMSHTDLAEGANAFDQSLGVVSYSQVFWYSLSSYLLAKNVGFPETYFYFGSKGKGRGGFRDISYPEVYSEIKLGPPVGNYFKVEGGMGGVYLRHFENGSVLVNPYKEQIKVKFDGGLAQVFPSSTRFFQSDDEVVYLMPANTGLIVKCDGSCGLREVF